MDIVFCIDATGSMGEHSDSKTTSIEIFKQKSADFCRAIAAREAQKGHKINQLRVRVVAFRDYLADGDNAMLTTDFFLLPQQTAEFEACINSIHAQGGGDIPEDGLEALAYAIKSNWTKEGTKKRHIIVVWTDAGTHEIGYGSSALNYPNGMPHSLAELNEWWESMNVRHKRLILLTPNENYWKHICENWDNVAHIPSVTGDLTEYSWQEMIGAITNAI